MKKETEKGKTAAEVIGRALAKKIAEMPEENKVLLKAAAKQAAEIGAVWTAVQTVLFLLGAGLLGMLAWGLFFK